MSADWTMLLSGVVGSTAYGLAGPGSDIDVLGVYAAPTESFLGLHPPVGKAATMSTKNTDGDVCFHEAGKFVALALRANPTVTELLWLPDSLYQHTTSFGLRLIGLRRRLLSAKLVRDAYLGYATQQFRRLQDRGDGTFSSDTRRRTAKHARHLARLLWQGEGLYLTGSLLVHLPDDQAHRIVDFGERVAGGDLELAARTLQDHEGRFDRLSTALPDRPDETAAEQWLVDLRRALLTGKADR